MNGVFKMDRFFMIFGFIGQAMFSGRFLIQWIASEKKQKSVIPNLFWTLSILGSLMLLIYAIYRKDPVIILGQAFGLIVYIRNLMIIRKNKKKINKEGI